MRHAWWWRLKRPTKPIDFWQDSHAIRADLFGTERLEHHAISLATEHRVKVVRGSDRRLSRRLKDNATALLGAYQASAASLKDGQAITPAAEWLLDNFHTVDAQLRQIEADLPPDYYHQLPKLQDGPFAGYPRVLELAWAYVAHTDSLFSATILIRFVQAYQTVQPLTIGELWAIAITLRIVMIENMRRLSMQIVTAQQIRLQADQVVDRVLAGYPGALTVVESLVVGLSKSDNPNSDAADIFCAQIAKRLRGADPTETPLLGWLQVRLQKAGSSIETIVMTAQLRQGATNITMRNLVTSMRLISEVDWAEFFETVSLIDARLRTAFDLAAMDFPTRNDYRTAIETLARGANCSEAEVTEAALKMATDGDPGAALIGDERRALERHLGYRVPYRLALRRGMQRLGLAGYLGAIGVTSAAVLFAALLATGASGWALAILGAGVAVDAGMALVNLVISRSFAPRQLPALALISGIPPELRVLVAVPVLLSNASDLLDQIERLEVHYLSSVGGAVSYALLSDGPDAATESTPQDGLLIELAQGEIARLNARYPSEDGPLFLLLHRRRLWNAAEGVWMGWERKRGKLAELNRLLRGATDTSFVADPLTMRQDIRYVITLDADTRLLRDTVRRMVGKMAHPLNRPKFDIARQRVVKGYGILQPRVAPSLPLQGSFYQRVVSSPGGIDPYAAAISDVYQDLFKEGSFTGKGIYDVDAFAAAMAGRVSENTMLSHDLFEGIFARAGLASDIQVVEDFPARQDVDAARQHRWTRGDWQLLPWIMGQRQTIGGIPAVGRWKMLDNLRRSLTAPLAMATLFVGWTGPDATVWTLAVLTMLALPSLISLPFSVLPGRAGITSRSHFESLWSDAKMAVARVGLNVILLSDSAYVMLDAITRSLVRLRTKQHLLEWKTAAQAGGEFIPSYLVHYKRQSHGLFLGLTTCLFAFAIRPESLPILLPFGLVWLAAPAFSRWISRPRAQSAPQSLTAADRQTLRLIARRTWRYFETFVTAADNFLPPDNFQDSPKPVVARRTSPTNIGLYLLSITAAHDMGWIHQAEAAERLAQTLQTMLAMPRFRGHLYNWYDTGDLRVLDPPYVSSVDSGNLAGHLITVAQACEAWAAQPAINPQGLQDARALAQEAALTDPALSAVLAQIADGVTDALIAKAKTLIDAIPQTTDAAFWTNAMISSHSLVLAPEGKLRALAEMARRFAMEMDFRFLLHPEKKLLAIGFTVSTNTLDPNCYDLLASEARLASLFAIAKGDVETRHWFRLGRAATPIGAGSALISWSGSMFEYLMPALVMRAPSGSVLEQTSHRVVQRQRNYAAGLGLPWGISESAFNARDLEMTYQYSNFGVPGLGLKRGLAEDRVIAPYATALGAMVDAQGALQNFAALTKLGAQGRYGFFEALDFTASRLPAAPLPATPLPASHACAIVRSFMAHHQGMTIAALVNVLQEGRLRARFHAEPMIQAVELLLQERVPRDASVAAPHAADVQISPVEQVGLPNLRRFDSPADAWPSAHLLSNGSYSVTLTPTGGGFSRWNDLAVTRWRADPTQAGHGAFLYLRDVKSGAIWSAASQPLGVNADHTAVFCDHHAAFTHQAKTLITHTEVVVSGEDDAEARRVTLTNIGRNIREVDVTSYAELVLAPPAADLSHPAFSKLFVVTDFLPELGVLIATRRRRAPSDPEVWAAHIAVVEGEESAPLQYESDRARFLGRGQTVATALMANAPLSGTTGTVLDPIFSLRRRVLLPAGGRARVTFWTMLAPTAGILLDMVDRHRDASAFGRAATLAWTHSQVQLRHHGVAAVESADFQRLAGMLIRHDPRLRASAARIATDDGPQSRLWAMGISGDLPILLFIITDAEDIARLREVLAAQDYWRMRQLAVDLVILNDRASSYVQDLQMAIETAVRSAQARPRLLKQAQGSVQALRSDLMPPEARAMLVAAADVILNASRGGIGSHLDALAVTMPVVLGPTAPTRLPQTATPQGVSPLPKLEFFNGQGGFANDGREYLIVMKNGETTPAPWMNVIANPDFGFGVSADGSGSVWSQNSRENQLTPWSNDPVIDPAGEAIYLHDLDTEQTWTPTALPIRSKGQYLCRHGFGYSVFEHSAHGIAAELLQFVAMDAPVKVSRLRLHNLSDQVRRLSVTGYCEWVLGTSRSATAGKIITEVDPATGAILARNPRAMAFGGRVAFADFGMGEGSLTCDRAGVFGSGWQNARPCRPESSRPVWPSWTSAGCLRRAAAKDRTCAGANDGFAFLDWAGPVGRGRSGADQATRARSTDIMLAEVTQHWNALLSEVQVHSPDRAMDILLNGWLLYQTLSCRIWARAGFYQASGAYGFRDQLQDNMALTALRPDLTRAHLLRAASRQFPEGDVQHWWLAHSGQGVRTRISDDRVWLAYAAAQYIKVSGDLAVLDEALPFLEGPSLMAGAHDDFFQPQTSDTSASLFEHCARALDQAIALKGSNGLPLIGTGDWNDGMNRVGEAGRGTSVWLGWFLIATLRAMAPHVQTRDPARAAVWHDHAERLAQAIEREAWDGAWYRRGTYDDGTLLGSAKSLECQIDSLAQSWAVLSGAADPARAAMAMASLSTRLIRPNSGLALLFTPPFDHTPKDPGYIKGYPPGLRENGGQYSHAAMWAILAKVGLGDGDGAHALFALINPINHALTPEAVARYKVEPYVIAADVYSTAPHEGRGGWTWYTGSAAWMYRAGIEGLLGLSRAGPDITLGPCFPKSWPELTASLGARQERCDIIIRNPNQTGYGVDRAWLNGTPLPVVDRKVTLARDLARGRLELRLI
jgi:cyclic beta-1,2-glucan synthetase